MSLTKAQARAARKLRKERAAELDVRLSQRAALRRELGRSLPKLDAFQVKQSEQFLTSLNFTIADLRKSLRLKGGAS